MRADRAGFISSEVTQEYDISAETQKAYIITGPTSGFGLQTAHRLASHGKLILVGRNRDKQV